MLSETLRRQEAEWENLGSEEGSRDREDGEKARLNTLGKVRTSTHLLSLLLYSIRAPHDLEYWMLSPHVVVGCVCR